MFCVLPSFPLPLHSWRSNNLRPSHEFETTFGALTAHSWSVDELVLGADTKVPSSSTWTVFLASPSSILRLVQVPPYPSRAGPPALSLRKSISKCGLYSLRQSSSITFYLVSYVIPLDPQPFPVTQNRSWLYLSLPARGFMVASSRPFT